MAVSIEQIGDHVHIRMTRWNPLIISSPDKCRKGIEVDICDKCGDVAVITAYEMDKKYCNRCKR